MQKEYGDRRQLRDAAYELIDSAIGAERGKTIVSMLASDARRLARMIYPTAERPEGVYTEVVKFYSTSRDMTNLKKIAIVGYREFDNYALFKKKLAKILFWHYPMVVLSRGTSPHEPPLQLKVSKNQYRIVGVDYFAEVWAWEKKFINMRYHIDPKQKKYAGPRRDISLVRDADIVLLITSGEDDGTREIANFAQEMHKKVKTIKL